MSITYALDLPINEVGGPEHAKRALQGKETIMPANYSFVSTDGTRLVYHVCGAGPLLLVATCPGWGVGVDYMPSGMSELYTNGKITMVILQTRGTFPSERPADETRMGSRDMAIDLEALRIHLGQDKINILGHSNGSGIVLTYAELFPEHCSKAVLIATQVIGYEKFRLDLKKALEKRAGDERFANAVEIFSSPKLDAWRCESDENLTQYLQDILPLYFFDPEPFIAQFIDSMGPRLIQCWPFAKQEGPDSSEEANLIPGLHKVTANVLLISGAEDFICSLEMSQVAIKGIGSKARHIAYEKCGHMQWVEHKEQFNEDILEFLGI
ncbi:hypothetical protein NQ176_g2006 [Zarea fungicola]|uniref:Uncharacterized protein n=1 Tax=Zarea fungicola TaxID=93591 RepID=A0ACC1NRC2_9HYPO|nr:hypothetical protein NQ176_g2006 [Lecanicillium fungicola]